jgi:hypothetical protein
MILRCLTYSLLLLSWVLPAWSAPEQPGEAQVKSAIILNMARYVDWPAESFSSDAAPISFCYVGQGALAAHLPSLRGKTVKGHPVSVRRMSSSGDIAGCHLVVLDATEYRTMANVLDRTRHLPILTVGDISGFSRDGGMVELLLQDGKVRFEINLAAARQSRLKVSSQLLKVARIVRGE